MIPPRLALLGACLVLAPALRAADARFQSGPARVSLLELYTSEGCSSCPPAEAWLDGLRQDSGLWRDYVPVAFHVDYWDRLGWPDGYASRASTERQYALAASWKADSVYTPCFVRDGMEWRPAAGLRPAGGEAGILSVVLRPDGSCLVRYAPATGASPAALTAQVALLGGGLSSRPNAGENKGATLRHEFTVLAWAQAPLPPGGQAEITLPRPDSTGAPRLALAAWVSDAGRPAPRQATGGWLR